MRKAKFFQQPMLAAFDGFAAVDHDDQDARKNRVPTDRPTDRVSNTRGQQCGMASEGTL